MITNLFRYCGVAAASTFVDWVVFVILIYFGLNHLAAQGVSRVAGGLCSFFWNRFWSFQAVDGNPVSIQGRRFLLLYAFSYCLSISLLLLLVDILNINVYPAKLMADAACFLVNFLAMKFYVYHDRDGLINWMRRLVRHDLP